MSLLATFPHSLKLPRTTQKFLHQENGQYPQRRRRKQRNNYFIERCSTRNAELSGGDHVLERFYSGNRRRRLRSSPSLQVVREPRRRPPAFPCWSPFLVASSLLPDSPKKHQHFYHARRLSSQQKAREERRGDFRSGVTTWKAGPR